MSIPSSDAPESGRVPSPVRPVPGAMFALAVLFGMNLLNYVDRYVFAAVGPAIVRDLNLTQAQFGILASSFIIAYTVVSPLIGLLGDRTERRRLMAFGVGLWSLATVATAFARTYDQMLWARAVLGIGEATYGVVAPAMLADFFEPRRRGKVMGIFYLALPLGAALGYAIGGGMEELYKHSGPQLDSAVRRVGLGPIAGSFVGWRSAFWVVGLPGLGLALAGLLIREPGRGAADALAIGTTPTPPPRPGLADYLSLLRTPSFLLNTAGLAAITFTTGALGNLFANYFEYVHHLKDKDKIWLGCVLAVSGLIGVSLGLWVPERLRRRTRRAYLIWAGGAVALSAPIGALGLIAPNTFVSLALLAVASVLLASCLGPCNTVTANVVPGNRRAAAYAMSIFLLHVFGDIPSPPLIGWVADMLGTEAGARSPLGRFLSMLGATRVEHDNRVVNLTGGMLLIVPVLLLGSACLFWGAKYLPRDEDRARAEGGAAGDAGVPLH
jgi:MFS family permease